MANEMLFSALADSTRRRVLEELRTSPSSVGELAARFPVSRPAISQHLRALKEAGLVSVESRGTRRIYRVDQGGIEELKAWVESFWADALEGYRRSIDGDSQ